MKQARTWTVWISNTGKARATYDPDEIDQFFVIDGDFNFYLIPVAAVGGPGGDTAVGLRRLSPATRSTYSRNSR